MRKARTVPATPAGRGFLAVVLVLSMQLAAASGPLAFEGEACFNFIAADGQGAGGVDSVISEEIQGVAHDRDHWFISRNGPQLVKIPVTTNVADKNLVCTSDPYDLGPGEIYCRYTNDFTEIGSYDHIGGIDHHGGLVFAGLHNTANPTPGVIGVFAADDFEYVAHGVLVNPDTGNPFKSASWVAIMPARSRADAPVLVVHDSNNYGYLYLFDVNWDTVAAGSLVLTPYEDSRDGAMSRIKLLDEAGANHDWSPQGGVFSPSGAYLYLVNGCGTSYDPAKDGINVFPMDSLRQEGGEWVLTRRRLSSQDAQDPFWFDWEIGSTWNDGEPEGLTFWDLDADGRSPHRGQLHVLLLDNEFPSSDDDFYFFHYTDKIYVDNRFDGTGKPQDPFATVGAALGIAWDGSVLMINGEGGSYPEAAAVGTRMEMRAQGAAPAVIGR